MREIKFRWWVTGGEPYGDQFDDKYYSKNGNVIPHMEKDLAVDEYMPINDEIGIVNAIPMQYTGLKDKNGRDIYEGDVLKRTVHIRAYGTDLDEYVDDYLEVEFRDEYAGFFCGERPLNNFVGAKFDVWTQCPCTDVEVVGNIYENPSLLKSGDPT